MDETVARPSEPAPRFRRRLTGAFVLVAACAAGALALTTLAISSGYRNRTFEARSQDEARLALALAPDDLTEESFERLQAAYESRSGASTLARSSLGIFSSSPGLDAMDIPVELADPSGDEIGATTARIDGVDRFVLASRRDDAAYWFFFSREPVEQSLRDLRAVLLVSWVLTVIGASLVGRFVARRTLQPVRDASQAAQQLASGLLETRLEAGGDDEFGRWSESFNEMAAALQRTIDRLQEAAERERQFTADIAHELRTPLTTMATAASLIDDELDALPEPFQRAARLLVEDVQRLRDLVLELLELARVDAGSEPTRPEPLDARRALTAAVEPVVVAHGIEPRLVEVDIDGDVQVQADRARLRRIIANLVDNALRHGSPPVHLRAVDADGWTLIEVRDHGPGVEADRADRLFDRFAKSDASRTSGGSGLGLAIAAGHARAMGGTLSVRNHPGGGAVFDLRLPGVPRGPAPQQHIVAEL